MKGIAGDKWTLVLAKRVTMEQFWYWYKVDAIDGAGNVFTGTERYNWFKKELWFELEKSMLRKHSPTFHYNVKFIHNDILKPFIVGILQYSERVRDMHDIAKYLRPLSINGGEYYEVDWDVCDKEVPDQDVCVATGGGLPTSIQDNLDNTIQYYCFVLHK